MGSNTQHIKERDSKAAAGVAAAAAAVAAGSMCTTATAPCVTAVRGHNGLPRHSQRTILRAKSLGFLASAAGRTGSKFHIPQAATSSQ